MRVKVPLSRKKSAPRNLAAKALRGGSFQPKVEEKPDAYRRRVKHPKSPIVPDDEV